MENVDTEEELEYGRRMAQYRSNFLQKQIADEEREKEKAGLESHGDVRCLDSLHLCEFHAIHDMIFSV